MRADKAKSIDLVTAEIVKNPLQTEREIAEKIGVGKSTVNRAMAEVGQNGTKDSRIISLTDADYEMQIMIQSLKIKKLKECPDKISDSDLNNWDKHSMTRYTLLTGEATDAKGGQKLPQPIIDLTKE